MEVSSVMGYPQIIQVMDDHDLVLKSPWWLEDPLFFETQT